MAGNKSSEVIERIMEKSFRYNLMDVTDMQIETIIKLYEEHKKKDRGSFIIDIDCSDALKGLKAVQREAKKATAALKELEEESTGRNRCSECGSDEFEETTMTTTEGSVVAHWFECKRCGKRAGDYE